MNPYIHWIKKNWLPLALGILVIILWGGKSCDEAGYKRDIKELDEEIIDLETDNRRLEGVAFEAHEAAMASEGKVEEKEASIAERDLVIKDLRKRGVEVVEMVTALPPSGLVVEFRRILECPQIELTKDGILFPVECARASLAMIAQFSLLKEEIEQTGFSLTDYAEALQFQKTATWNVYRIAWAQGSQIVNYRGIIERKDLKFIRCENQRKKSFWNGLKLGLAIGAGVTVTFTLVIPAIKSIF